MHKALAVNHNGFYYSEDLALPRRRARRAHRTERGSRLPRGAATLKAKLGQAPEMARAGGDFAPGERAQAVQPKPLDREAAHHRSIDDGAAQRCVAGAACAGQAAHETTGEAIARAGGIVNLLERIPRHGENGVVMHHHGHVLAALDHTSARATLENVVG